MLILTRRVSEKLVIGKNVTVTVLLVRGNQVRIGIDAPRDITVNRDEIFQRILKERKCLEGEGWANVPTTSVKSTPEPTARTLSLSDKG